MNFVEFVLGYILVGIVISFGVLTAGIIGHWRGKNDGDHDMDFLAVNVVAWPLNVFIVIRETWRMHREKKP